MHHALSIFPLSHREREFLALFLRREGEEKDEGVAWSTGGKREPGDRSPLVGVRASERASENYEGAASLVSEVMPIEFDLWLQVINDNVVWRYF